MEYKIGIIEDTKSELNAIKRTIYSNLSKKHIINYIDYKISVDGIEINDDVLVQKIKDDILNNNIMLLIIDNKLVIKGKRLKGTSIYEKVKKITSDFPIIILTNYKDEAYDSDYVDPDKVYDKEQFFSNNEYTKEKINSISLLIDKYNKIKNNILAEKKRLINEYERDKKENQEKLNELLKLEIEIKKYSPVEITYLEELISPDYIREIVNLLDEIKDKLD